MSDDIITRLRESDGGYYMRKMFTEAADEIERLRGERDGARAEVCLLQTATSATAETVNQSMADYAESRGWKDLFREDE